MKKLAAIFSLATLAACSNPFEPLETPRSIQQSQLRNVMMETMMLGQHPGEYTLFPNKERNSADEEEFYDLIIKINEERRNVENSPSLCANFRVLILGVDKDGNYLLPYMRSAPSQDSTIAQSEETSKILPDFQAATLLNIPAVLPDEYAPDRPYFLNDIHKEICLPVAPGQ